MNKSKKRKVNPIKPIKMTYPIYLVIKKFGKDLGNEILSFLFQCDSCGDMTTGPIYVCKACSDGKNLCRQCWDLKGLSCWLLPCFKCYYCGQYHCLNHNSFWLDDAERIHLAS